MEEPHLACTHQSSSSSTTTTTAIIFSIPEIAELILVNLDMRTLLISALRVSRHWNRLITDSPALQRKLFFRPIEDLGIPFGWDPLSEDDGLSRPSFNPLLVDGFGTCFFDFRVSGYSHHLCPEESYLLPFTPKACEIEGPPQQSLGIGDLRDVMYPSEMKDLLTPSGRLSDEYLIYAQRHKLRFTRQEASWRRMFVMQPPPPRLAVLRWHNWDEPASEITSALIGQEQVGGLRMGFLYDYVYHNVSNPMPYHTCSSRVIWGQADAPTSNEHLLQKRLDMLHHTWVVLELHDVESRPENPMLAHLLAL